MTPKVIEHGTIRKLVYSFLSPLHSSYGTVLYDFRDKARYWSKNAIFHIATVLYAPVRGSPVGMLP